MYFTAGPMAAVINYKSIRNKLTKTRGMKKQFATFQ